MHDMHDIIHKEKLPSLVFALLVLSISFLQIQIYLRLLATITASGPFALSRPFRGFDFEL